MSGWTDDLFLNKPMNSGNSVRMRLANDTQNVGSTIRSESYLRKNLMFHLLRKDIPLEKFTDADFISAEYFSNACALTYSTLDSGIVQVYADNVHVFDLNRSIF